METQLIDETTELYLGHWRRLVSTTNWDKGRIICQWRQTRTEAGATPADISDEAWSRGVGNVTGQHVGRLRRTWERFSTARDEYAGLYWSHFQAATDWDDAEMWLEGAVQNDWSVMDMRRQRAATLGLVDSADSPEQAAAEPVDEDADSALDEQRSLAREVAVRDPAGDADERGAENHAGRSSGTDDEDDADGADYEDDEPEATAKRRDNDEYDGGKSPLADLPSLPADVSDAFEAFKLCILRHKLANWSDLSRADLLRSLDALKELALATAT